ncbi:MAG: PhzF family phenazine biosynthesis protein [Sulfuritalea sp.]|nr:PhzF family phenazine biosynthesis protein [Sulfuritalea sp.]
MALPFHIVDVFAQRPYAGNPLAVVLDADGLTAATMQLVAAETNYSETTFVHSAPEADGGFRVRIFTPARELAFAGHPLLGTAWVIRHHLAQGAGGPVRLNIGAGQVPVSFESAADGQEVAWFAAPPMQLGATCPREPMAAALGIAAADIDPRAPVQQVAAGTAAMIVPLRSREALRRCRLDLEAYAPLAAQGLPPLIYLFCTETDDPGNQLCVRFFFEAHGVREDPATGNGAAFLGAWLLEHRWFPQPELALRIEQGADLRRPSLVLLRARGAGAGREVSVGGGVVPVIRGELL